MIVKYKCRCLAAEVEVEVPERGPAVDIVLWVEQTVGSRIGADHAIRSPACRATVMEYVKIPYRATP